MQLRLLSVTRVVSTTCGVAHPDKTTKAAKDRLTSESVFIKNHTFKIELVTEQNQMYHAKKERGLEKSPDVVDLQRRSGVLSTP
jgi:hypothetical protein